MCFFWYYYCLWSHTFMTSTKNDQQIHPPPQPPPAPPTSIIRKNEQIYCLERVESAKYVTNFKNLTPTPLLCGHHKCMFLFRFFKVWSVTRLNVNEILNFMKIQSNYLLLRYQRNQAYISHYISFFWTTFWWVYVSNYLLFAIRNNILFLKCKWWKWEINEENF